MFVILKLFRKSYKLPIYLLALLIVLVMRSIRPYLVVRIGGLISSRIGHFAGNTELYLCERDAGINIPEQRYIDLFYFAGGSIANLQLAKMWRRVLRVGPSWLLAPVSRVNASIPGGRAHNAFAATREVDIHNLLERFPTHLQFTPEEESRGASKLKAMGIPIGAKFVCLMVRDSAYLDKQFEGTSFERHNYRDSAIQTYVLAANSLAEKGFFVIRMGAIVRSKFIATHPRIIDYATNGMRDDFMDIYLGAHCVFCLSTGTGWDSVPEMFRRPIAYVNFVPLGNLHTFRNDYLSLVKKHIFITTQAVLTLNEIFENHVAFGLTTSTYEQLGVALIDNTPEEIQAVAVEMADRVTGAWRDSGEDEILQKRFWQIYKAKVSQLNDNRVMHGDLRGRYSAAFLRENPHWLL